VPCLIPGAFAFRQQHQTPRGVRREGERMLHRIVGKPTRFRALGQFVKHQNIGDASPGSGAIEVGGASDERREDNSDDRLSAELPRADSRTLIRRSDANACARSELMRMLKSDPAHAQSSTSCGALQNDLKLAAAWF